MDVHELSIGGALVFTPRIQRDSRGAALEAFRADAFRDATGHDLTVALANTIVSAAGTVRGIHFTDVPPGRAKYVSCPSGAILDVVVDLRVSSPTFGRWEGVLLEPETRRAVYVPEGLGHGFMALEENTVVHFLCSNTYDPAAEHGVDPFDEDLAVDWPTESPDGAPLSPMLSDKDESAPSLAAALAAGVLPQYDEVRTYLTSARP